MSQYLPFGRALVPTDEQIKAQEYKFNMYEVYGIPYGILDNKHEGEQHRSKKDRDRDSARILIMQGKDLPEDLKKRLLQYKQQDN